MSDRIIIVKDSNKRDYLRKYDAVWDESKGENIGEFISANCWGRPLKLYYEEGGEKEFIKFIQTMENGTPDMLGTIEISEVWQTYKDPGEDIDKIPIGEPHITLEELIKAVKEGMIRNEREI